jgi:hypothetical protein
MSGVSDVFDGPVGLVFAGAIVVCAHRMIATSYSD